MSQFPESGLIRRIQAGDEDALVELHTRFVNLVYSVAYSVLNEPMAAEEVTQDTFMRVWDKSDAYDAEKGRFVTWLLTITRRLAIDLLRQRQRKEPDLKVIFMDENPDLWENILESESTELRRTLLSVMRQIPREQAEAIELAYFYGLAHSDIAEALGEPLGTVKTRIRLGMQKLRQAWDSRLAINPAATE